MTDATIFSELLIHLQPDLVYWYIIISRSVLWKDWIAVSKVTVKISMNICLDDIFWNSESFVMKLGYGNASS